jgi:hypothetical protein
MEYRGELTPLETRLVECAVAGDEVDCAPTGVTTVELTRGKSARSALSLRRDSDASQRM